jgi:cobalt/nickel transport system ATP-binding protein
MTDAAFRLKEVEFAYDRRVPALAGVDLHIPAGQVLTILGANGSGKSTLLKLLDGLYFPTRGEVFAFGDPLTEEALREEQFLFSFRRRVGLVFQDPDVQLFSATVWDEIAFGPLQLGLSVEEVKRRVAESLSLLRIEGLRDRSPHRLSGGEKKRVAIASVLCLWPDVWLLDEPTAGLDPRSQSWLIDFILDQRARGKTVVVATHDLDIVDTIADEVCVLGEDHRVARVAPPAEVLADRELLLRCNLIHEHRHPHRDEVHRHAHLHYPAHAHNHDREENNVRLPGSRVSR